MAGNAAPEVLLVPQSFPTIQAALDAACGPVTVVVAPGFYGETLRIIDKLAVVIQSARLSRRGVTLSGGGDREGRRCPAVVCVERSTLFLSGIEVRSNGRCRGLLAASSSISLQECLVVGNQAGGDAGDACDRGDGRDRGEVGDGAEPFGAGMLCRSSKVRIQKSAVVGNLVTGGPGVAMTGGGGIFLEDCQGEIAGSTIQANAVYAAAGARGGGLWCERSTLRMWRSRVTDNSLQAASCAGAGIYFAAPQGCQLGGSVIMGNGSSGGRGGGILVDGDAARVAIHRNTYVGHNHPTDVEYA